MIFTKYKSGANVSLLVPYDEGAALAIDNAARRLVSVQSLMELVQGARDKDDLRIIRRFLAELDFRVLPLTENIGHRSLVYVEEYGLSAGLRAGDAIIAATAV